MAVYKFGKLEIDPNNNPAVLDDLTWDIEKSSRLINADSLHFDSNNKLTGSDNISIFSESYASCRGDDYFLAAFEDGQHVFLRSGNGNHDDLGAIAFKEINTDEDKKIRVYPVNSSTLHNYITKINIRKGPRALGAVPRLGIGVRHSSCIWPGVWKAMNRGDFSANAIQNSVRELHLLETLKHGEKPRENYLFSFGSVQEGHTGSTFEGLWVYGVLSAIKSPYYPRYGADADHLQVKRGTEGVERTKEFIRAARYYSFYTLDVSDILDYSALWEYSACRSADYLQELIPNASIRKDIINYHRQKRVIGKIVYELDEAEIGRFVGKYWKALSAVEELNAYIAELKSGEDYDLELSIDETPYEINTFDAITTNKELLFLVEELRRRTLPLTHLAPNFGVEKCTDYRGEDGLEMLARRVTEQSWIASENGLMLDCHSGDDLSRKTRQIFGSATKGRIHYKISPSLQVIYAETLKDMDPEFFEYWWKDTLKYTEGCAESGSLIARDALAQYYKEDLKEPSPTHFFFKEFNFATLGKRGGDGQFINRDRFYSVSNDFQRELTDRLEKHLCNWAEDLFNY